jgi:hypothetical protein
MTKADLGLPSAIQDSTYHENREKEINQILIELENLGKKNKTLKAENEILIKELLFLLKGR